MINTLFRKEKTCLSSGSMSMFKIDCDNLTGRDWEAAAWLLSRILGGFRSVTGIPKGGIYLEAAMRPYIGQTTSNYLIVDDVLTTGQSMEAEKLKYVEQGVLPEHIIGGVLFARGPCPGWIQPLFRMDNDAHRASILSEEG